MALIEGFPDSPRMSPRISFSHDLSPNDVVLVDEHCIRTHSASAAAADDADFDFCVFHQESSTADELFSDGKILPIQIKKRLPPPPRSAPPSIPPPQQQQQSVHEPGSTKCPCSSSPDSGEEKHGYKPSFWRIKRSTSLNCGSGYAGTLCPLPILSRSNSTGSASGGKRSPPIPNPNNHKHNFIKYSSQPHNHSPKQSSPKPPLKKNSHSSYSNNYSSGIRINPILNVPPANLFGLGSIFSSKKK